MGVLKMAAMSAPAPAATVSALIVALPLGFETGAGADR